MCSFANENTFAIILWRDTWQHVRNIRIHQPTQPVYVLDPPPPQPLKPLHFEVLCGTPEGVP
jgi:hypothetical protein